MANQWCRNPRGHHWSYWVSACCSSLYQRALGDPVWITQEIQWHVAHHSHSNGQVVWYPFKGLEQNRRIRGGDQRPSRIADAYGWYHDRPPNVSRFIGSTQSVTWGTFLRRTFSDRFKLDKTFPMWYTTNISNKHGANMNDPPLKTKSFSNGHFLSLTFYSNLVTLFTSDNPVYSHNPFQR